MPDETGTLSEAVLRPLASINNTQYVRAYTELHIAQQNMRQAETLAQYIGDPTLISTLPESERLDIAEKANRAQLSELGEAFRVLRAEAASQDGRNLNNLLPEHLKNDFSRIDGIGELINHRTEVAHAGSGKTLSVDEFNGLQAKLEKGLSDFLTVHGAELSPGARELLENSMTRVAAFKPSIASALTGVDVIHAVHFQEVQAGTHLGNAAQFFSGAKTLKSNFSDIERTFLRDYPELANAIIRRDKLIHCIGEEGGFSDQGSSTIFSGESSAGRLSSQIDKVGNEIVAANPRPAIKIVAHFFDDPANQITSKNFNDVSAKITAIIERKPGLDEDQLDTLEHAVKKSIAGSLSKHELDSLDPAVKDRFNQLKSLSSATGVKLGTMSRASELMHQLGETLSEVKGDVDEALERLGLDRALMKVGKFLKFGGKAIPAVGGAVALTEVVGLWQKAEASDLSPAEKEILAASYASYVGLSLGGVTTFALSEAGQAALRTNPRLQEYIPEGLAETLVGALPDSPPVNAITKADGKPLTNGDIVSEIQLLQKALDNPSANIDPAQYKHAKAIYDSASEKQNPGFAKMILQANLDIAIVNNPSEAFDYPPPAMAKLEEEKSKNPMQLVLQSAKGAATHLNGRGVAGDQVIAEDVPQHGVNRDARGHGAEISHP